MFLHVGLGNPGKEYELHRHNVGFMVIDSIISKYDVINCKEKILGDGLDSNKDTMLLWKYTLWKYGGKSLL